MARLWELNSRMRQDWDEPLSEVSRPRLVVQSIRFVSPDAAMVDVANVQFSSGGVQKVPALFVMRRQREGWRIASVRLLAPARGLIAKGNGAAGWSGMPVWKPA